MSQPRKLYTGEQKRFMQTVSSHGYGGVSHPNFKVLLRSKFNVKFFTKMHSFQLIRSGCTCFGH